MLFSYPLKIRFKLLTLVPAFFVTDSRNEEVLYTEQKFFALRESIKLFNNSQDKKQIFAIKTQQVIDIGAQYYFYKGMDETSPFGSIREEGLKTLFKASYLIYDRAGNTRFRITETNPWIKVADELVSMVPYLGLITGYFFNPKYQVIDVATNQAILNIEKKPSFWERQFEIQSLGQLSEENETIGILGVVMMIMLQKNRG